MIQSGSSATHTASYKHLYKNNLILSISCVSAVNWFFESFENTNTKHIVSSVN